MANRVLGLELLNDQNVDSIVTDCSTGGKPKRPYVERRRRRASAMRTD